MGIGKETVANFRIDLILRSIGLISGSILIIFLARLLGPNEYGILFLALSIVGLFKTFSTLGIIKSSAKYITEYKEKDCAVVQYILRISIILLLLFVSAASLILILFSNIISGLVGEQDIRPLLIIGAFYIFFHTLYRYSYKTAQAFEEIRVSSLLRVTNPITQTVFVLSLVLLGFGALGAMIGYILSFLFSSVIGLIYIYSNHFEQYEFENRFNQIKKDILSYSIPLLSADAANVINSKVDTILVGFFLNPAAVGFYTISKQVVQFVSAPAQSIGFTLAPTYEAERIRNDSYAASRMYEEALSKTLLLYVPASAGLILIAEPFIFIFFGVEYQEAILVLQVMAVYAIAYSITNITSSGLNYLGRAKHRAIAQAITALFNLVLNLILIPTIGVVGAAVATVFSFSIYCLVNIYIMFSEIGFDSYRIINDIFKIMLITLSMTVFVIPLLEHIRGVFSLLGVVFGAVFVWLILSYVSGMICKKDFFAIYN